MKIDKNALIITRKNSTRKLHIGCAILHGLYGAQYRRKRLATGNGTGYVVSHRLCGSQLNKISKARIRIGCIVSHRLCRFQSRQKICELVMA